MKLYIQVLLVFLLTGSGPLSAQDAIGIRAGLSISNWAFKSGPDKHTTGNMSAFTFGVPLDFPLSKHFSLQPELNYISKGGKDVYDFNLIGIPERVEQIIFINYLEVPVFGKFIVRSGSALLHFMAGPSVAYGLDGYTKLTQTVNGKTESDKQKINFKDDELIRLTFSLNLALGFSVPWGMNRFFFDFRYQAGLTNLAAPANNGTGDKLIVRDNTIQFSAGMFFPLSARKRDGGKI